MNGNQYGINFSEQSVTINGNSDISTFSWINSLFFWPPMTCLLGHFTIRWCTLPSWPWQCPLIMKARKVALSPIPFNIGTIRIQSLTFTMMTLALGNRPSNPPLRLIYPFFVPIGSPLMSLPLTIAKMTLSWKSRISDPFFVLSSPSWWRSGDSNHCHFGHQ